MLRFGGVSLVRDQWRTLDSQSSTAISTRMFAAFAQTFKRHVNYLGRPCSVRLSSTDYLPSRRLSAASSSSTARASSAFFA